MEISPADLSLGESAVETLLLELEAYPKPGLVSPRDSGAHDDMDYALMCRSAIALLRPFASIAAAGREGGSFEGSLIPLGLAAEREMLLATGGVNTHRGAIFSMGLIVAAMARAGFRERPSTPDAPDGIRAALLDTWGDELKAHVSSGKTAASHGAFVLRTTGTGGARAEAARGFPGIFETGLPAYRSALASGLGPNAARIQTLFALMEAAEDSNVIFRGGPNAADFVRRSAAEFLVAGGCSSDGWFTRAEEIHRDFVLRNISPGGCADLLAGTLLVAGAARNGACRPEEHRI